MGYIDETGRWMSHSRVAYFFYDDYHSEILSKPFATSVIRRSTALGSEREDAASQPQTKGRVKRKEAEMLQ